MTLFSDKNNNTTIVSADCTDIISSRMHYLHPEYVDEKSKFIYSQSRCPLSMLAETCKNVGKPVLETGVFPSQEPSVSISPSCSSSCSAPKFSPHSMEYSPVEQSKIVDATKDKPLKDKTKKRKSQKKEPEVVNKRPLLDGQPMASNYAISEFLKLNNVAPEGFSKPETNNVGGIPLYNHIVNHNIANQFNHSSSIWKVSKNSPTSRMAFPLNYLPPAYPNIPMQNGLYRCPPTNILHDLNQFYNQCLIDKPPCDCLACSSKKSLLDKSLVKLEPLLFNFLHTVHKERSASLAFLQNAQHFSTPPPPSTNASAIKYCMYCGQCIPIIQNLLNHIHTEHIDCIHTNLCPKIETNFSSNFNVDSLQSKEGSNALKNVDILKQLQFIYNNNNHHNDDHHQSIDTCAEKAVLMK